MRGNIFCFGEVYNVRTVRIYSHSSRGNLSSACIAISASSHSQRIFNTPSFSSTERSRTFCVNGTWIMICRGDVRALSSTLTLVKGMQWTYLIVHARLGEL